jgi:UDP-N-acetylmuramoyl-tripeptide--D-alanyl-D-alanine ligase
LQALQLLAQNYLMQCQAKVVGITGSNGKTTTKDILFSLLTTKYKVHKTQGNYNNHIGLPLTILSMPADTEIVVLEMGMSGRGEIELLSKLAQPESVIVTNIGEAHLLQLGSRLEIARAKLEILSGLKDGGLFVYHGDEPLITEVLAEPTTSKPDGLQTATFGLGHDNDEYASGMMNVDNSIMFVSNKGGDTPYRLPLLGEHNVVNCLGALIVARHYGISEEEIAAGLSAVVLTGMRIEIVTGVNGITILNDAYNASPLSMKAAISVIEQLKGYRRKFVILGDMLELGELEEEYHREVGRYLGDKVDQLFTLGSLARFIAEGASEKLEPNNIHAYTDKMELIDMLKSVLQTKDAVLVKGSRGMKLEEVVDAIKQFNNQT